MGDEGMGEIVTRELTESGQMVTRVVPMYTCGHCSQVVVLRPDRVRERRRCAMCKRLICETSELCRMDCTPIQDLARDHFEADPRWTRLLPATWPDVQRKQRPVKRACSNGGSLDG